MMLTGSPPSTTALELSQTVPASIEALCAAAASAERARILRTLHDTVLQDLEAMALHTELDRHAPDAAVAQLRGAARRHALRLRRAMSELTEPRPANDRTGDLTAALAEIAGEYEAVGLRVELVASRELPALPAAHRNALCEAVRSALGNVLKHAGVTRTVVRVCRAARGVEVVVRDHGRGFDAAHRAPGFGLRQSIVARLAEVGGAASIQSWLGRGTRVRLWAGPG